MDQKRSVRVVVRVRKQIHIPIAVQEPFGNTDLVLIRGVISLLPFFHRDGMRPLKDACRHAVQARNVLPVDWAHVLPGDAELVLHPPEQRERV